MSQRNDEQNTSLTNLDLTQQKQEPQNTAGHHHSSSSPSSPSNPSSSSSPSSQLPIATPNELKQRQKSSLSPLNVRRLSSYAAHNEAAEIGPDDGVLATPPPASTTININTINNNNSNTNNNNNTSSTSSLYATPPLYQQQLSTMTTTTPLDTALDDKYKLFTIYNGNDPDNEKLSGLPHSTTGSLSSIITTSIASSEPDPGAAGGGGGGGSGPGGNGPGGGPGGAIPADACSIAGINGSSEEKLALNRPGIKQEKWTTILLQVSIPFFLAGIGTIGAGIVLGRVEKWYVFKNVSELFILVPALLGLKGNLDMCLASRLSTQVNLGNMTSRSNVVRMIVGNIALVQVQATVASFLVAMFAMSVGAAMTGSFYFENAMLLTASAMFTATSSCFVLDFVLVAVILFSQKYRLNPDNLATPLAASIGDVVSISLLSFIASLLYEHIKTHLWITFIVVTCYLVLLPMWVVIVLKNEYTRPVLKSGWVPVLSALCISGLGGLVLDAAVEVFNGFVVFQPIINGIGGNLVSVQASKISTMLHQSSIIGIIPPHTKVVEWPWRALFKGVPYAKTARILIAMSIPGNVLFIFVADYINMNATTVTWVFMLSYLVASLVQVMLLLYIAHIIVHAMWKWKIDPDNSAIPYLTALGDLLGSSLLAVAWLFTMSVGMQYGSNMDTLNAPN
ncbi:solute carrier family 41 member 1 isoform X1 [Drosophila albomicans]|uniref:Solute carrier family 41 member 1 isoform X1 n=1 Tax=Drosophila albomicans TaxID=7291 RepID=A0A6P8Y5P9_DROAB|nr:solute carrier family 41 member 1 isoform X1 [Drosophila albomicans]XP_034118805.1 solute carrier family 41 member 1 isoform X1 [Drosophila albomicans]XP_034118812.1 solute carrier family 41 member 1 isoform X1 [Drosophila albomicans]XP_051860314.1 solute carrier family 41 member 1 isoform X1 [Drosophila albomicans]